jgi:hypothetical protein
MEQQWHKSNSANNATIFKNIFYNVFKVKRRALYTLYTVEQVREAPKQTAYTDITTTRFFSLLVFFLCTVNSFHLFFCIFRPFLLLIGRPSVTELSGWFSEENAQQRKQTKNLCLEVTVKKKTIRKGRGEWGVIYFQTSILVAFLYWILRYWIHLNTMKQTSRKSIRFTSSSDEISSDQLRNRVVANGEWGHYSARPPLFYSRLLGIYSKTTGFLPPWIFASCKNTRIWGGQPGTRL